MQNINTNYSNTGFAEFVHNPSQITFDYLKDWFCGASSLGGAMNLLQLPYTPLNKSVLELIDGELLVNLEVQYQTFYKDTLFKYSIESDQQDTKRALNLKGLINPTKTLNTLKILFKQAYWIGNPKKTLEFGNNLLSQIPSTENADTEKIEELLRLQILPRVFAIAHLSEFYSQLLQHETKGDFLKIQEYISKKQLKDDWFAHSIFDQFLVRSKKMSFDAFMSEYGIRADKDYELTCPRWIEIPDEILKRINSLSEDTPMLQPDADVYNNASKKTKILIDTLLEFQLLRSQAKKKALTSILVLRKKLIQQEKILNTNIIKEPNNVSKYNKSLFVNRGRGVSIGIASGLIHHVYTAGDEIPSSSIGVFPNASPEFSIQYPKCIGMIFLTGGTTSHGAIVAREFGIPALINESARNLPQGLQVSINGQSGECIL